MRHDGKMQALLIIVVLAFLAGYGFGIIYENIVLNEIIEQNIIAVANENSSKINANLFRIGDDVFRVENVKNISGFVWSDNNDSIVYP